MDKLLINKFNERMKDIYFTAKKVVKYNATIFWQMVCEQGGYETAKRLLDGNDNTQGFATLAHLYGKPELTMEWLIYYNQEFRVLFSKEEIEICKIRLGVE